MFRETDVRGRRFLLLRRIGSGGDGGNGKHDGDDWCGGDVGDDDGRGGWGGKASKDKMEGVA